MSKTPPTAEIWKRRERLEAMAARGTPHEQTSAEEKLRRLKGKYDFSRPNEDKMTGLFSGWTPKKRAEAIVVLSVDAPWMDVGSLVKWVFANKFRLGTKWRHAATHADLMLEGCLGDLVRTKDFARALLETLQAACLAFFGERTVSSLERAPFLSGLYDGLLNEVRPEGSMLPGYSPLPKKKPKRTLRAAKSAPPAPRVTTVHPYDLGRAVGQKIRLDVPRNEICDGIRAALQNEES